MAVTIDKNISEYYSWGSYPFATWGGERLKTWGNAGKAQYDVQNDDYLAVDENLLNSYSTGFKENVSVNDSLDKVFDASRSFNEGFGVSETYWDNIFFNLNVSENILVKYGIQEELKWSNYTYKTWGKSKILAWKTRISDKEFVCRLDKHSKEYIGITEKEFTEASISYTEAFKILEGYNHKAGFIREPIELLAISENVVKEQSVEQNEFISISGKCLNAPKKNMFSYFRITGAFAQKAKFGREYTETIGVTERKSNRAVKAVFDSLHIRDTYLKPVNAVLSNLYITEGEYSDKDFVKAINTPPGYTEFIDFKVGEYDYQEALVRVSLFANTQAQPTAQGITMHVDIPDTDDRGTYNITKINERTQVPFNKFYYTVPEVQVTLRSASTASGTIIPSITNITTQYFEVELLTTGGARTTGVISWVAKGY